MSLYDIAHFFTIGQARKKPDQKGQVQIIAGFLRVPPIFFVSPGVL